MTATSSSSPSSTRRTRARNGAGFSLSQRAFEQPATPLLQDRIDLATVTGSPVGPELVAGSRASCNRRVAYLRGRNRLRVKGTLRSIPLPGDEHARRANG